MRADPGTPTLDQLRVFVTAVEVGSFAGAARKLNRATSVVSYTIANLEAHHFKYRLFRRPGDVHLHYFGTATLSFSEGVRTQKGDVLEIQSEAFGLPLRNRVAVEKAARVKVRSL